MDIGVEGEPFVVEPLREPVPGREPVEAPDDPVVVPEREKVPA